MAEIYRVNLDVAEFYRYAGYRPFDVYVLAKELAEESNEAKLRTAISRAYYGFI